MDVLGTQLCVEIKDVCRVEAEMHLDQCSNCVVGEQTSAEETDAQCETK